MTRIRKREEIVEIVGIVEMLSFNNNNRICYLELIIIKEKFLILKEVVAIYLIQLRKNVLDNTK